MIEMNVVVRCWGVTNVEFVSAEVRTCNVFAFSGSG